MKIILLYFLLLSMAMGQSIIKSDINESYSPGITESFFDSLWIMKTTNIDDNDFLISENLISEWSGVDWINDRRFSYTYDEDNLSQDLYQIWQKQIWNNYSKSSYVYGEDKKLNERYYTLWSGQQWVNDKKNSYFYENDDLIKRLEQKWKNEKWNNNWRDFHTYDENHYQTERLYQRWTFPDYNPDADTQWVSKSKDVYIYDDYYNLTEHIIYDITADIQKWDTRHIYTYDENNNLIEDISQWWGSFIWTNEKRETFKYDDNYNLIENIIFWWDYPDWVYERNYTYSYSTDNKVKEKIHQYWVDSLWVNVDKYTYTYEKYDNLYELLKQAWNGSEWENKTKEKYTFEYYPTSTEEYDNEIREYTLEQNYPNPFNPSTTIKYSIPFVGRMASFANADKNGSRQSGDWRYNVTLKVYDILGRVVATLVNGQQRTGYYEVNFDASHLSSGIYFYSLQAGEFRDTKKMLLLR